MWGETTPRGVSETAWKNAIWAKGPVIVTVHGTGSASPSDDGERWWQCGSEFLSCVVNGLTSDAAVAPTVLPFHWTGANSDFERVVAARQLRIIIARLKESGKRLALLAHSHGGNVVYYALRDLSQLSDGGRYPETVVSFGTPFLARNRKVLNAFAHGFVTRGLLFALAPTALIGAIFSSSGRGKSLMLEHQDWLSIRSRYDEPIALLSNVRSFNVEFVSIRSMKRAIVTALTTANILLCGLLFIIGTILIIQSGHPPFGLTLAAGVMIVIAVYWILYVFSWGIAVTIAWPAAKLANRGVVGIINNSALGQDHDYNVDPSVTAPPGLPVKEVIIDTEILGDVTPESRRDAAERLYRKLSSGGGVEHVAADPLGVWNDVNAALYHNAYFDDPRVIDETVAHVLGCWRLAETCRSDNQELWVCEALAT